jgi:hypothetical protein
MLLSERFNDRTIANMDVALELSCRLMPLAFESHAARKFVAEKIVQCAVDDNPNTWRVDGSRPTRGG